MVNYSARPRPDCKDDDVNGVALSAASLVDAGLILLLRGAKLSDSLWNSNGITPKSPAYRFLTTCRNTGPTRELEDSNRRPENLKKEKILF